jgi:hypothetical protein
VEQELQLARKADDLQQLARKADDLQQLSGVSIDTFVLVKQVN